MSRKANPKIRKNPEPESEPSPENGSGDHDRPMEKKQKMEDGNIFAIGVTNIIAGVNTPLTFNSSGGKNILPLLTTSPKTPLPHSKGKQGNSNGNGTDTLSSSSSIVEYQKTPSPIRKGDQSHTPLSTSPHGSTSPDYSAVKRVFKDGAGSGVSVELDLQDGKYVLTIEKSTNSSLSGEHKETKQLGQSAAMLLLQAEVIRDMGEQLLAQYRASLHCVMGKPASRTP